MAIKISPDSEIVTAGGLKKIWKASIERIDSAVEELSKQTVLATKEQSFTEEQKSTARENIGALSSADVPTKVSELENDSKFISTVEHDETITGDGTVETPLSVKEMVGATGFDINAYQEHTEYVENIGGVDYKCVRIGNYLVMAENFALETADSFAPNLDDANVSDYGRLYNFPDAKNNTPDGWKLPTVEEWSEILLSIPNVTHPDPDNVAYYGVGLYGLYNPDYFTTTADKTNSTLFNARQAGIVVVENGQYVAKYFKGSDTEVTRFWCLDNDGDESKAPYMHCQPNNQSLSLHQSYQRTASDYYVSVRYIKTGAVDGEMGLVPTPLGEDASKFLRGDGTWADVMTTVTTDGVTVSGDGSNEHPISAVAMKGATATEAGSAGIVTAPVAGDEGKFLRGDAAWTTVRPMTNDEIDKLLGWD